MTKEERKEYMRQYYLKNKDRISSQMKNWRNDNKDYTNSYMKKYRKSKNDGYHRVYLLEDYDYVGVTSNLFNRFDAHKQRYDRDCTNHRILYKTKNRKDALELEELLHDIGFKGKHKYNRYN